MKNKLKIAGISFITLFLTACGSTDYYKNGHQDRIERMTRDDLPFLERLGNAFSDGFYLILGFLEQLVIFLRELFFNLVAMWPIILIIVLVIFLNKKKKTSSEIKSSESLLNIKEDPLTEKNEPSETVTLSKSELEALIDQRVQEQKSENSL